MLKPLPCLLVLAIISSAAAQERGRRGSRDSMRVPPIMQALDADGDGEMSADEIAGATAALLSLDTDGDGNLTTSEMNAGERRGRGPGGPGRGRPFPPIQALDKDGDGELFEDEVTDAAESLAKLDANGDGRLDREELMPPPGGFGRGGPGRGGSEPTGPVPHPNELAIEDGTDLIATRDLFRTLSYEGPDVMVDTHLKGYEYIKFQLEGAGSDDPHLYFMNTKTHRSHPGFMNAMGIGRGEPGQMRGVIVYRPMLRAPNGEAGLYTFEFQPNDAYEYEIVRDVFDLLESYAPLMRDRLAYNLMPRAKTRYLGEQDLWDGSGMPLYEDANEYTDIAYLPLHMAESYGRLRIMHNEDRPAPRDVVLCPSLPNEMPRVAGVITGFRQTPLSHVNLRAVQDNVPNAYIAGAETDPEIAALIGKYVYYRVDPDGYELREATSAEVDAHFAALRPTETQVPPRDLSVREIRAFSDIGFDDAATVGVKAANLATLRTFGLPGDQTPDGFAVPFSFYDAFMQHNGFDRMAQRMIATADFRTNANTREEALAAFRKAIRKGKMPGWMMDALGTVQARFPRGMSIRCRSSTNNEDLPGFSGAGLYDSYTHHPDEGHLSKSIKQVFASLWNFRAYEERSFHRIDHFAAAMGVVLHPNSAAEQANGVAVTRDILYGTGDQIGLRYYVNAQVGEDLVTNPDGDSVPEELLLSPRNPRRDRTIRRSNRTPGDEPVLSDEQRLALRRALRVIHDEFAALYRIDAADHDFAMEVEFKVEADGELYIKQARPWVE